MDRKPSEPTILLAANTDWYLYNFRVGLIKTLLADQAQVVVVCPSGSYADQLTQLGCRHFDWQVGRKTLSPPRELRSILRLREIYRQVRPALVHHHTLKAVIYGSMAACTLRIPVVNSIAGLGFVYSSRTPGARLLKILSNLALRSFASSDRIRTIFENPADQDYFLEKRLVRKANARLIPGVGVDTEIFSPSPPPRSEHFVVGYVGRLLNSKGVGTFIQAARMIKHENPPIRMVLIGKPDPGNPESIDPLKISEWVQTGLVEWWGWRENMPEAYQALHAIVFPTEYGEGVPTVLLEAAASERAIIASDSPGCRVVVEDGVHGLLVPPANPGAAAARILDLAENRMLYDTLRKNARKKVVDQLSLGRINQETLAVYNTLLTGSHPLQESG